MWVEDEQYKEISTHIQQLREESLGIPVLGVVGECAFDLTKHNKVLLLMKNIF
jgi:hypothetical protein